MQASRVVVGALIFLPVIILNLAFFWAVESLWRVLLLVPGWVPEWIVADYLSAIQFPVFDYALLDYYYLTWLAVLFVLLMVFFRSTPLIRLLRTLEVVSLVLLALPIDVYFFDRGEFTIRVMDAQVGTPLAWFTNADFMGVLVTILLVCGLADSILAKRKLWRARWDLNPINP